MHFGLIPAPLPPNHHPASVGKHELERRLCTPLIQLDAAPASCGKRQAGRCDPDPGWIDQAHLQVKTRWRPSLRQRTRNPVRPLRIATQLQLHALNPDGKDRTQSQQALQGIEADAQALDGCCGLIGGSWLRRNGTEADALKTQSSIATQTDRMAKRSGHPRFNHWAKTFELRGDHTIGHEPERGTPEQASSQKGKKQLLSVRDDSASTHRCPSTSSRSTQYKDHIQ